MVIQKLKQFLSPVASDISAGALQDHRDKGRGSREVSLLAFKYFIYFY